MYQKIVKRLWDSPTAMTWGNMLTSSIKLLVLTPLILVRYNVNEIAFWYLLLTINSFTVVVDFGFYPTFSRVISYAFNGLKSIQEFGNVNSSTKGDPNWNLMGKVYGTINTTYLTLGIVVILLITAASYSSIQKIVEQCSNPEPLWIAYALYILSIYFQFFAKKFDAVIIGTNHVALINRWNMVINTINALSAVLIVYAGLGIVWLSFHQLAFTIILNIRSAFLERWICDGKFRTLKKLSFDREVFQWCWGPTWKSGILILCSTGVSQASGLIYSHIANPVQLASYLLSLKLVTTISQFSQAPFYSKLPVLSGLRVKNDINLLSDISANAMRKALLAFVIGMAVLVFFGDWGLTFIGANSKLIDSRILMLMAFIWFLERHHAMHAQIYVTTNKVPFYKSAIVTGIVNIGLVWLLLPRYNVVAFPIAQGVSNLLINNWWNVYLSLKSISGDFVNFFRKSLALPFVILIITVSAKIIQIYTFQ